MAEVSSNDVSFIKVSKELYQVRSSVEFLNAFKGFLSRQDNWARSKVMALDRNKVLIDELRCFSEILPYVSDDTKLQSKLDRLTARMAQLELLVDTYMKGGDILSEKLSQ